MKKFFLPMLALGALCITSCNDDPLTDGGNNGLVDDGEGYYISARISLPSSGSRSATDEDGNTNSNGSSNSGNEDTDLPNPTEGDDYEYGYDYENDVRSMILVFTDNKDQYLTHLVVTGMASASVTGFDYVFTQIARIPYGVLDEAYGEDGLFSKLAGVKPNMHIYAFCNFTQNLLSQYNTYQQKVATTELKARDEALLTEWRDFHGSVEEKASMAGQTPQSQAAIWSPRSFLMANAEVYNSTFPASIDDWDQYADDRNPLQLTSDENGNGKPIPVERVAARLDFRDASEQGDQVYPIRLDTSLFSEAAGVDDDLMGADTNGTVNLFSVKLSRMVLVNMSKDFYYLRRTSNDGTMNAQTSDGKDNNVTYAGKETTKNYVVDYNYDKKLAEGGITPANADQYFNFPLYDQASTDDNVIYNNMNGTYGWYISNILKEDDPNSVLKGSDDNWNGNKKYQIWRYVTENTIPSVDQQKTIQSTGIIFKAAIQCGSEVDATYMSNGEEVRYVSEALEKALKAVESQPQTKPTLDDGSALPAIYSFHNMMFGGVPDIVAEARRDGNGGSLYFAVDQILKNWYYTEGDEDEDGNKLFKYSEKAPSNYAVQLNVIIADEILNESEVNDGSVDYSKGYAIDFTNHSLSKDDELYEFVNSQFIELAPSQNITVFVPTKDDTEGWGYYCYYFYWNRHNDNGLSGKMGPMEFATVRNNVYKLAVTKISAIGHPRMTYRDPDPVNPEDPDEEPERSIEVQVNVLPWVVRVNNIEF